jgi:nucleotide-binding universal stress UspA family protein
MYKTILVHVDGSAGLAARLEVAAALAARHAAHLVGSAVTGIAPQDYLMLGASPMGALPAADYDLLREHAAQQLQAFTAAMQRLGVASWEQRIINDDAEHALMLQSAYADLLVLSPGTPPGTRARLTAGLAGYVALHCTRPVLVVPDGYGKQQVGSVAVVGWDASSEACRAVAAALPLLRQAASVKVAVINPDSLTQTHGESPGADLATYLARHGVPVEVVREHSTLGAAPALLGLARDVGADLLVAGAYGHSRYREWLIGGATASLLDDASIPLLLAH